MIALIQIPLHTWLVEEVKGGAEKRESRIGTGPGTCGWGYESPNGCAEIQVMHEREGLRVVSRQCSASRSQVSKVDSPVMEGPTQLIARAALRVTMRPVELRELDIGENIGEDMCAAHSTLVAIRGCSCSNCGDCCLAVRMNRGHWNTCCVQLIRNLHCNRKREEFSSIGRGSCWVGLVASSDVQH